MSNPNEPSSPPGNGHRERSLPDASLPQDPGKVARRADEVDAALDAWRRTAEARRDRWNEAQADIDARAAERRRQVHAVFGGMGAGVCIVALVGIGIAIGTSRSDGPDGPLVAALTPKVAAHLPTKPTPPALPPDAKPPVLVAPPQEPKPPIAENVEPYAAGDFYGARFDTRRSRVHVVFVKPTGEVWRDEDDKRWCKRSAEGTLRSCQYARELAPYVADGSQPEGRWVVKACDDRTHECEPVIDFNVTKAGRRDGASATAEAAEATATTG